MTTRNARGVLGVLTILAMAVMALILLDRPALGLAAEVGPAARSAGDARTSVPEPAARPATFRTFRGEWTGHTRSLRIRKGHVARERISLGCCEQVADLTLEVRHVRGTVRHATIEATVTKVRFFAEEPDRPAPAIGDVVRLGLDRGVLTEPASGTFYCNEKRGLAGVCGA